MLFEKVYCEFATAQSETWKLMRFGVFINTVSKVAEAKLEETGGKLSTDKANHFFLNFSRQ